jgi:hypothetical protein
LGRDPAQVLGLGRVVVDVIWRADLVEDLEAALVEGLLDDAPGGLYVGLYRHR